MNSRTRLALLLLGLVLVAQMARPVHSADDDDDDDDDNNSKHADDAGDDNTDDDTGGSCNGGMRGFNWPGARASWPSCAKCQIWGVGVPCIRQDKLRPENCNGSGMRYCTEAHLAEACPEPCQNCESNTRKDTEHRFFHKHSSFSWEDVALSGHYDNVFVERDGDKICIATCWRDPWEGKCTGWKNYRGLKFCENMNCEHDPNNRVVGCHRADTTQFNGPFHKPTCKECAKIFPKACGHLYDGKLEPSAEWRALKPSP